MSSPRAHRRRVAAPSAAATASPQVTRVTLVGGVQLLLTPSLSREEIAACLTPTDGRAPAALRDVASRVLFPLSLLALAPSRFQTGEYEVVCATAAPINNQETAHGANGKEETTRVAVAAQSPRKHAKKRRGHRQAKRATVTHTQRHHQSVGRPEFVDAYDLLPRGGRLAAETEDDGTTRRQSDLEAEHGDEDEHEHDEEEEDDEELLRELDLTDFELPQLVHVFTQASPRGELDAVTFESCVEKILSQSGRYDPQAQKMFLRLFAIFDADSEGVVDVAEFLGGVSVFASGARDDKIRCIFELYDGDQDGLMTLEEMTKYLTAVFIVIAETSPELFQQKDVDPMELGAVTARQCFQEAHLDAHGRLSFEAFQKWYSKPGPTHLQAVTSPSSTPKAAKAPKSKHAQKNGNKEKERDDLSLARLRELTGLANLTAEDLFSLFSAAAVTTEGDATASSAAASLSLSRDAFKKCFFSILQKQKKKPSRALARFLDRLFNVLDRDGSDTVDFVELSSGLSILCGGSRDDKVVAAFSLFDADGDGFITREEMEKYLASVFHVVYESHPETKHAMQIDAGLLAKYTTQQAFAEADLNHDDKLSLEEFRKWYTQGGGSNFAQAAQAPLHQPAAGHPSGASLNLAAISHEALFSVEQLASLTGLRELTPSQVFEVLATKVDDDGVLSRDAVHETFDQLFTQGASDESHQNPQRQQQLHSFVDAVFEAFDVDRDGVVDFCELASGLSVCCRGSQQDKVRAAFTLFDINQDGFITSDDMETYLASVFRMLFTASGKNDFSADELARVTTRDAFAACDADQDGRLSLDEFTKWYSSAASATSMAPTSGSVNGSAGLQPVFLPLASKKILKEMQELTNLGSYDVNDILEFFEASSDAQGGVNKPSFFRCFSKLLAAQVNEAAHADKERTLRLLSELFELFDTDGNGTIDIQELGAGLSILCGGNLTDKTRSLFTLYDLNHDGFIAPDEMIAYLTAVFKVLYKASPQLHASTGGLSPAELAVATTNECFQAFDKNSDHQLSYDEFKAWIDQQKASAAAMKAVASGAAPVSNASSGSAHAHSLGKTSGGIERLIEDAVIPVDVAKKLTGLHTMSLDKAAQIFSSAANESGQITREAFDRCFYQYVCADTTSQLTAQESTRVHEVIDRLFTAFDNDSNGLVDLNDLSSGLSILCGGSHDDKVQAAFDLYDTNGDGLISEDEMVHYLSSVFKLLYALDPTRQTALGGVSASELAAITASEIFSDADRDHDGKLNLEEFKTWYGQPQQASFNAIVAPIDLDEVRRLTNLGNVDVVDVFERFADRADAEGLLYRAAFDECIAEIIEMASHPRSDVEKLRAKVVADRLFDVFDRDHNGFIDFSELASGLSVLCKGARDAKVKAAFRLYDFNGDGFISLEEMTRYLSSIFKVLYEVQPQMQAETGVSADELGAITAEQAFLEADRNRDGKLSYDEFLTWYNSPSQAGISSVVAKNAVVDSSLKWMPLQEIKTLTNLAQFEPEEVFEVFAAEANTDGLLSRAAFHESFEKLIHGENGNAVTATTEQEDQEKLDEVINGLFDLFDADNSGFVDFGELASGLSVLCGGTQQQKVRAAFSLFDFNGDGFISLDEMTRYLTSVFRVLFQVSPPETPHLEGVSPEELGQVTAQQAFLEADQDKDGRLTFDEFQQWYQQPGGIGEVAKDGEQLFSLAEARRLTENLQAFESPIEVFEALAECADDQGFVSKQAFDDCFRQILTRGNSNLSGSEYERITAILQRLFELFDVDKNGLVDFSEISCGLSVVCGGTSDEKVKAAFALYDYNGDGFISLDEMARYLTAVFKVLQEASPRDDALAKETPEALGLRTAKQAFEEADMDKDGKLSFTEFRQWYSNSSTANIERLIENNIPEWLSLQEVRRVTNLGAYTPGEVFETFASFASATDGTLNKDAFRRALTELQHATTNSSNGDRASEDRLRVLVDRMFALFDTDHNGVVDFSELASGLSVLCGGTENDKARAAFNLYDVNHDGFISLGEMRLYLTSVFKVLYEVNPETQSRMSGVSPEELGEITAQQAFAEADADGDGRLSFEEFRNWYLQPSSLSSGDPTEPNAAHVPDWVSLQVVKEMTHLSKYEPSEVFEVFANRCSDDGTISREDFEDCFEQLIDAKFKTDEPHLARVRIILDRLFTIFDTDGNGVVDFCELTSGLSVLCGGSREDKVRSAFALYDLNQDGFISLEEMVRYLTSVFKVLYETNPGTREKLSVEPEELALITAEQCFVEADLNHDGRLSFDEFVRWYSQTQGLGVEAPGADVASLDTQQQRVSTKHANGASNGGGNNGSDAVSPPSMTAPHRDESYPTSRLFKASSSNDGEAVPLSPRSSSEFQMNSSSMERARGLLKLDSYEVNDVFEIFAEAAPSGELTFANFKKCFDQIIKLAGGHETPEEKQEAEQMVRRLFRVLDADKSNTVDFGELASGLSVLSGSSMDDKVRAAFQLYDINGDGFISEDEMVSYMTSIFKVMYETSDATKTKMDVAPEELARVTATQCFKEADLNNDGKLSFDEFKKWCTSGL